MARDISSFTKRMANQGFKWHRNQSEVRQITKQQLTWLLDGLSVSDTTVSRITDKILPVAGEGMAAAASGIDLCRSFSGCNPLPCP